MLELIAIIHGNVQGVGFRATSKRFAESLELKGFVRNLSDGTVEICAQGPKKDLEKFIRNLRVNFDIEDILINYRTIETERVGFLIQGP